MREYFSKFHSKILNTTAAIVGTDIYLKRWYFQNSFDVLSILEFTLVHFWTERKICQIMTRFKSALRTEWLRIRREENRIIIKTFIPSNIILSSRRKLPSRFGITCSLEGHWSNHAPRLIFVNSEIHFLLHYTHGVILQRQ